MANLMPNLVVLAGPNGAGKSTAASVLLRGTLEVTEFVNADVIAQGLSAFAPHSMALTAGRIMLRRLQELARQGVSFAFETTLASRSFALWIRELVQTGYRFHLVFLWLPSADFAIQRVVERVQQGGHSVPETTIRRRYRAGLHHFFGLYQPLAATWRMYDNSSHTGSRLIAAGQQTTVTQIRDAAIWQHLTQEYGHDAG
jgi:predicted ABC-type ATPase